MEFPVNLTKGEFKYPVDSQAALDFHLGQGWAIESAIDYTGLTAPQIEAWGKDIDSRLTALEQVAFPSSVADLTDRTAKLKAAIAVVTKPVGKPPKKTTSKK